ncbi:hypothetical protein T439DRAFT_384733 [Meredithblackwellia eburnea MCA 4105]
MKTISFSFQSAVAWIALVPAVLAQVTSVPNKVPVGFSWSSNYDATRSIPECAEVTFTLGTADNATPGYTPQGPFYLFVIQTPGGGGAQAPIKQYETTTSAFPQTVSIALGVPQGGVVTFFWSDTNGYSGGAVGPYNVAAGATSCSLYSTTAGTSLAVTPTSQTCGPVSVTVSSGIGPYNWFLIESDVANAFIADAQVTSNYFTFDPTAIVVAGQSFDFWVQDVGAKTLSVDYHFLNAYGTSACSSTTTSSATAAGNTSIPTAPISSVGAGASNKATLVSSVASGSAAAAASTQTNNTNSNHSSTPIGAIVGGVVGGIAVIAGALIIFFCLRRSSNKKKKEVDDANLTEKANCISPFESGIVGAASPPVVPSTTTTAFPEPYGGGTSTDPSKAPSTYSSTVPPSSSTPYSPTYGSVQAGWGSDTGASGSHLLGSAESESARGASIGGAQPVYGFGLAGQEPIMRREPEDEVGAGGVMRRD